MPPSVPPAAGAASSAARPANTTSVPSPTPSETFDPECVSSAACGVAVSVLDRAASLANLNQPHLVLLAPALFPPQHLPPFSTSSRPFCYPVILRSPSSEGRRRTWECFVAGSHTTPQPRPDCGAGDQENAAWDAGTDQPASASTRVAHIGRAGMGDSITRSFRTNGQPQGSGLGRDRLSWALALGWEVVAP